MRTARRVVFTALFLLSGGGLLSGCQQKTKCEASCAEYYSGLALLDWQDTFHKASLSVAGRLPVDQELSIIRRDGQVGLELMLDRLMLEEPFYERIKEIYNDLLLTDQYRGDGTMLLEERQFPSARYYEQFGNGSPEYTANAIGANEGVGREPLNLIAHVVREERPFKEILTANYVLVNAYSAQSYGLTNVSFPGDPANRRNLAEAQLPGIPHAGILTTASWMNRFPTSDTNRNRARARYVFLHFLDFDVLTLGVRPLTTSNIAGDNPTMNDPSCVACHQTLDPVAGAFQAWDDQGHKVTREWYKDMFATGFRGTPFTAKEQRTKDGVRWLAEKVVEQRGFINATVRTVFTGLTGRQPLTLPPDIESPEGQVAFAAYNAQQSVLAEIGDRFKASNYNFKVIVKNVILTPYFRAVNVSSTEAPERDATYAGVGMGRLLTPEQLNRKIKTTLALERYWGEPGRLAPTEFLTDSDEYLLYYGGIDSISTTTRITEPNGISVNIARRMANELSCQIVPLELSLAKSQRALFPRVTATTSPIDAAGAELAGAADVKANIQYLMQRVWGRRVGLDDNDLLEIYGLFTDTITEGRANIAAGTESVDLPNECRGTRNHWTREDVKNGLTKDPEYLVRGWMAVLSFMLADYEFLYE